MRLLFIAICACLALPAAAQLYVCADASGKKSITMQPSGDDCRLQKSYERTNQPATAAPIRVESPKPAGNPRQPSAGKKAAPSSYPVVSATKQKVRDKTRGKILLYELKREQKRQQLTNEQIAQVRQSDPSPDNTHLLAHLETQLHIHTQNIKAIRQELARL